MTVDDHPFHSTRVPWTRVVRAIHGIDGGCLRGHVADVSAASLQVRVLGPLAVFRNGEAVRLPQSKKTRALLAYLAITGRSHRRDRLCALLWDVADDPRGALRWSLSKIRPLVDTERERRLLADRESVELHLPRSSLDWRAARRDLDAGVGAISDTRLQELASVFRGELLEGLDLLDFDEFTAWCAAEREHARTCHVTVLHALATRYRGEPDRALGFARQLVRIDPLNQEARAALIRLLAEVGHRNEAYAQYESATRLLKELGTKPNAELLTVRGEIHARPHPSGNMADPAKEATTLPKTDERAPDCQRLFVGRREERARLLAVLDRVRNEGRLAVFLLKGEPGVGKTTLFAELSAEARKRGTAVFEGTAYEAESGRPYGPWIDALRRLPELAIASEHRDALAPLLPELGKLDPNDQSRDRLFAGVVNVVATQSDENAAALLLFDDIHWCDDATAELLHYVARICRGRRVAIVLGARDGELTDNESVMRALRSFRREGLIEEHLLLPLSQREIADLCERIGSEADATEVFAQSGGNPLLARELAQAVSSSTEALPTSLRALVGDRLDRLPQETRDVLRWAAILGPAFQVALLTELTSLDFDPLMHALSVLERRALLRSSPADPDTYEFHHTLVHQVVYSEISEPRRKLMHLRVAKLLEGRVDPNERIAMQIAHHAGIGGEPALAARACLVAGNRCLRMFANAEAFAHARRGLRFADALPDPERLKLKVELEHVSTTARIPDDIEAAAQRIEALAEQALEAGCHEHARLGFTVVSYLRWTVGESTDAHRLSLRAEFASRGADDRDRMVAMAEAARCLVVLERDVAHAEALLLEARALTEPSGEAPWAVYDGLGLLRLHAGRLAEAKEAFDKAWATAKKDGDRLREFMALEHLVVVSLHQSDQDSACTYAKDLAAIGDKLREGSERPLGEAMLALCRYRRGEGDRADLEDGLERLRLVDAKQRLSFVLLQAAAIECERGELEHAGRRAQEALELATIIQHPSHVALGRTILLRIARARGEQESAKAHARALGDLERVASHVRASAERELRDAGFGSASALEGVEL